MASPPHAGQRRPAARWVWLIAFALVVLHHDFWWYADTRIVLGFLPIGLAYHAAYSLVVAAFWVFAIRVAWPVHLETWADETPEVTAPPSTSARSGSQQVNTAEGPHP